MSEQELLNVIQGLEDIKQEPSLPKTIRLKIDEIIKILNDESTEISLRVNKALHALDEIVDEAYGRLFIDKKRKRMDICLYHDRLLIRKRFKVGNLLF